MSSIPCLYLSDRAEQTATAIIDIVDGDNYGLGSLEAMKATIDRQSIMIGWLTYHLLKSNPAASIDLCLEASTMLAAAVRSRGEA